MQSESAKSEPEESESIRLSPTKLSTFIECPRCFWMEVHKKMPPAFPFPTILNKMDRLFKEYYDKHRNSMPPALLGKIQAKLVSQETAEILRKGISFKDEELNAILIGKLDDCLIDNAGMHIPIDNKSRGYPPKEIHPANQLQLDIYALLLKLNGYKTAGHGYVIYYTAEEGDPDQGFTFSPDIRMVKTDQERAIDVFRKGAEVARMKDPPEHSPDCGMCRWLREFEE